MSSLEVVVTLLRAGGETCYRRTSAQCSWGMPLCLRMVSTSFFHGQNVIPSVEEKLLMGVIICAGGGTARFNTSPTVCWDKRRSPNVDLYCVMRETALQAWVVACRRRWRGRMVADLHTGSSSSPALASLEGQSCAFRFMIVLGIPPMPG